MLRFIIFNRLFCYKYGVGYCENEAFSSKTTGNPTVPEWVATVSYIFPSKTDLNLYKENSGKMCENRNYD